MTRILFVISEGIVFVSVMTINCFFFEVTINYIHWFLFNHGVYGIVVHQGGVGHFNIDFSFIFGSHNS